VDITKEFEQRRKAILPRLAIRPGKGSAKGKSSWPSIASKTNEQWPATTAK